MNTATAEVTVPLPKDSRTFSVKHSPTVKSPSESQREKLAGSMSAWRRETRRWKSGRRVKRRPIMIMDIKRLSRRLRKLSEP